MFFRSFPHPTLSSKANDDWWLCRRLDHKLSYLLQAHTDAKLPLNGHDQTALVDVDFGMIRHPCANDRVPSVLALNYFKAISLLLEVDLVIELFFAWRAALFPLDWRELSKSNVANLAGAKLRRDLLLVFD